MCIRLLSNSLCFVVLLIDALFLVNSFFGRYNCSRLFLTIATIFSGSPVFQRNRTELQEFHSYYYKKRRNVKFVNLVYFFCHLGFVLLLVMVEVMVVIVVVVLLRERFFCVWFHMFQVLQFGVRFLNFMLPSFVRGAAAAYVLSINAKFSFGRRVSLSSSFKLNNLCQFSTFNANKQWMNWNIGC
jgi:hypothetical protein